MTDFAEFSRRDLRLTILKSLSMQPGFTCNDTILRMEAEAVGLNRTKAVIRTELKFLESIGAVRVKEAGSVMVGVLTQSGQDHVKGLVELDGVNPPSPEA